MKDFKSDQEVRWCPGCGDYADPRRRAGLPARARDPARRTSSSSPGIGCSSRFPYYMNTYGMHSDPRPRPGHRHRPRAGPPRPVRVGRHRRRRRAVDRRQPPDPRPAPQRQPQDPAVQQPDLRPDQGPVLPDLGARQDHQVDADGLARHARSTRSRWRSARRRRSSPAPSTPTASTSPRCCGRPPPTPAPRFVEIYQNCNIFNDGAFDALKDRQQAEEARDPAGARRSRSASAPTASAKGVVRDPAHPRPGGRRRHPGERAADPGPRRARRVPTTAFALSRLADPDTPAPHPHRRPALRRPPVYDTQMADQLGHRRRTERQGRPRRAAGGRRHLDGRRLTPTATGRRAHPGATDALPGARPGVSVPRSAVRRGSAARPTAARPASRRAAPRLRPPSSSRQRPHLVRPPGPGP